MLRIERPQRSVPIRILVFFEIRSRNIWTRRWLRLKCSKRKQLLGVGYTWQLALRVNSITHPLANSVCNQLVHKDPASATSSPIFPPYHQELVSIRFVGLQRSVNSLGWISRGKFWAVEDGWMRCVSDGDSREEYANSDKSFFLQIVKNGSSSSPLLQILQEQAVSQVSLQSWCT